MSDDGFIKARMEGLVEPCADDAVESIAISLKRIADWFEGNGAIMATEYLGTRISSAISEGIFFGQPRK